MIIVDYMPCKNCQNPDVIHICFKCEKCGRKLENGFLLNGDQFPCHNLDVEEGILLQ